MQRLDRKTTERLHLLLENTGDMALQRRARRVIEEISPKDGDKIVDIGCGNGYYTYLLASLPVKLDLTGVDNDKKALKDAEVFIGSADVKLVRSDVYSLPFKSNSFNKAVMAEVIEHLDDPAEALKEVKRILKPGGILAITTTNKNYPFFWDPVNWTLERFFGFHIKAGFWAGIWNQHNNLFTPEELVQIGKKAGFKTQKIEILTSWCIPFNHYILNFAARMLYGKHLPRDIADSINKFKVKNKKPFWIRVIFLTINSVDKLNDFFPKRLGVSILMTCRK